MIINANALHIPLADQSVHCIVTSPPYWGLRNYGVSGQLGLERTPEEYIANMVAVFRECWRVLRDDGVMFVNIGDSYWNGGGEKRDGGHGFVDGGKLKLGAAKGDLLQLSSSTKLGLKPKDLVGIPWRLAFALQADGWYLRSDIIWSKPNPMPESVTDRPTKSHEYLFLLAKQERYYYDAEAIREENSPTSGKWGVNTASKTAQAQGNGKHGKNSAIGQDTPHDEAIERWYTNGRNARTVWTIPTAPYKGAHFATFPPALVEPCIKAGTSERGCCPKCGKGWRGVVEKGFTGHTEETASDYEIGSTANRLAKLRQSARKNGSEYTNNSNTLGWRPDCKHYGLEIIEDQPAKPTDKKKLEQWEIDINVWREKWDRLKPLYDEQETIPALVFDPFVGSGTTVKVAYDLGRRGVGLDLSLDYLDEQARKRIHNGHTARLF